MKIGVDAAALLDRSAGVKNYLFYWTHALRSLGADIRLFPFLPLPEVLNHDGSSVSVFGTRTRIGLITLLNLHSNPAVSLLAGKLDVFHAAAVLYPPRLAKLTATIHDLTCWLLPEMHTDANRAATLRFAQHVWKRADGLIAVSEHTRRDAIRLLDLDPARIEVIHHGVADVFRHPHKDDISRVREQYALRRPYALFVGAIEPRKNIDMLLSAWAAQRPDVREEFELVLAGPHGWAPAATFARMQSTAGTRYLGYVPESDLPGLLAGATVFVYPSLYEGFGLPVAEAMAAGVPVIASDTSCLPEIAADAAMLVDPHSSASWCSAMDRMLSSPDLRNRLAQAGETRAVRYSWADNARRSIHFFERIAGA